MRGDRFWKVFLYAALIAVLAAPALTQKRMGQGKGMPRYDPTSEMTVKGSVEEVKQVTSPMGWNGTHLTVKTDSETLEVHIGPTFYLEEQKFTFATGDQIEVTGSKVKCEGVDALLAREVKKGDKTLLLRNAQGIPLWSKSRRR
ncbi:MAG: DNA-binding protein [Acidobacteriota bacterium]